MTVEMRRIESIHVGNGRVRYSMGDMHELTDSMRARGLINPVTIRADGALIAGERRLAAARNLGWPEIACHIWGAETADELLALEIEENTCRSPLMLAEAEQAWQRYRKLLGIGQGKRTDLDLRPMGGSEPPSGSETSTLAARAVGYGRPTMERVQKIREAAEDETQPEPVRQVAQKELKNLQTTGRGATPALERLRQAQREATRNNMMPGQFLPSDVPQAPPKTVTWNDRLWKIIPSGALPGGIAEELEASTDTRSVSDDDLARLAGMLQEQIRDRQNLRKVLLRIREGRK